MLDVSIMHARKCITIGLFSTEVTMRSRTCCASNSPLGGMKGGVWPSRGGMFNVVNG